MPKKQTREFLVTDCDGTFLELSLLLFLIDELIKNRVGRFGPEFKKNLELKRILYLDGKISFDSYVERVVETFKKTIAGVETRVVQACANQAVKKCKNRVRKYTRNLINDCKEEGHFLILLSHSPAVIVEIFAKAWGFDEWIGTNYLIKNGVYTGEAISPHKGEVLQKLIKKHNLSTAKSIALGDTNSDIPMFELVSHPICINPPFSLQQTAKEKGWQIVVEYRDLTIVFPDGKALGANFAQI